MVVAVLWGCGGPAVPPVAPTQAVPTPQSREPTPPHAATRAPEAPIKTEPDLTFERLPVPTLLVGSPESFAVPVVARFDAEGDELRHLAWSAGGDQLAFTRTVHQSDGGDSYSHSEAEHAAIKARRERDPDFTRPRVFLWNLAEGPSEVGMGSKPLFAPRGTELAFLVWAPGSKREAIAVRNADGTTSTWATAPEGHALSLVAWTEDDRLRAIQCEGSHWDLSCTTILVRRTETVTDELWPFERSAQLWPAAPARPRVVVTKQRDAFTLDRRGRATTLGRLGPDSHWTLIAVHGAHTTAWDGVRWSARRRGRSTLSTPFLRDEFDFEAVGDPSGRTVLMFQKSDRLGGAAARLVKPGGRAARPLLDGAWDVREAAWSPDGRRLALIIDWRGLKNPTSFFGKSEILILDTSDLNHVDAVTPWRCTEAETAATPKFCARFERGFEAMRAAANTPPGGSTDDR